MRSALSNRCWLSTRSRPSPAPTPKISTSNVTMSAMAEATRTPSRIPGVSDGTMTLLHRCSGVRPRVCDISSRTTGTVRMRGRNGQQHRPRDDQCDDQHAAELTGTEQQYRHRYHCGGGDGREERDRRAEGPVDASVTRQPPHPRRSRCATANASPNAYVERVCMAAGISAPEAYTFPRALSHSLGGGKNSDSPVPTSCHTTRTATTGSNPRGGDAGCATSLWTETGTSTIGWAARQLRT